MPVFCHFLRTIGIHRPVKTVRSHTDQQIFHRCTRDRSRRHPPVKTTVVSPAFPEIQKALFASDLQFAGRHQDHQQQHRPDHQYRCPYCPAPDPLPMLRNIKRNLPGSPLPFHRCDPKRRIDAHETDQSRQHHRRGRYKLRDLFVPGDISRLPHRHQRCEKRSRCNSLPQRPCHRLQPADQTKRCQCDQYELQESPHLRIRLQRIAKKHHQDQDYRHIRTVAVGRAEHPETKRREDPRHYPHPSFFPAPIKVKAKRQDQYRIGRIPAGLPQSGQELFDILRSHALIHSHRIITEPLQDADHVAYTRRPGHRDQRKRPPFPGTRNKEKDRHEEQLAHHAHKPALVSPEGRFLVTAENVGEHTDCQKCRRKIITSRKTLLFRHHLPVFSIGG